MQQLLQRATAIMNTVKDLQAASAVLNWDQETYMPDGAAEARAEQIATIDTIAHQTITSNESQLIAEQIRSLSLDRSSQENRLLLLFLDEVEKSSKLPEELVRETSKRTALAQESWKKARAASDFSLFAPDLEKLIALKTKAAELLGYSENKYDALLNLFEPGITVAQLKPVFANLLNGTKEILRLIDSKRNDVSDSVLYKNYSTSKQIEFATSVVNELGFDTNIGRVDLSAHPFCTSFAPTDVRLTTRVFEDDVRSCLFGLIHEAGHGMYEQGFDKTLARTFGADGASMGIHESQSLFWENMVARSEEFWSYFLPKFKETFPEQTGDISSTDFYKAINLIAPSFIRIEADEITYNVHIIIRFEIEEALINGTLAVADIPNVWNEKMQTYLGITPPNDAQGCLQDIHWSFGGFGYFPSYTLGKLYAAMLRNAILRDIPNITEIIEQGNFAPIVSWLRENIHRHGKTKTPHELIVAVSGKPLSEQDFLEYAMKKAKRVYNL